VIVFAAIGPAYDHDDEVFVVDVHLFIAHRRLEQVAVVVNPGLQVEWFGHRGMVICLLVDLFIG
jgi:hypothetical protein